MKTKQIHKLRCNNQAIKRQIYFHGTSFFQQLSKQFKFNRISYNGDENRLMMPMLLLISAMTSIIS